MLNERFRPALWKPPEWRSISSDTGAYEPGRRRPARGPLRRCVARFGDASSSGAVYRRKAGCSKKQLETLAGFITRPAIFRDHLTTTRRLKSRQPNLAYQKIRCCGLDNVGQSEARLGDFDAARLSYERSLRLAQSIQDQNEILVLHVDLGYLLLKVSDLNAAEAHIREATRLAALRKNNRAQLNPMLLEALLLDAKGRQRGCH